MDFKSFFRKWWKKKEEEEPEKEPEESKEEQIAPPNREYQAEPDIVAGPLSSKESPNEILKRLIGQRFDLNNSLNMTDMSDHDLAEIERTHVPTQGVYRLHPKTGKVMSSTQIKNQALKAAAPNGQFKQTMIYANPQQHLDYRIIESILKSTFIGALVDTFIRYLVGNGFKPELEVIHPSDDKEADKKLIEDNQQIIRDLIEIDRQVDGWPPTDTSDMENEGGGEEGDDEKPKKEAKKTEEKNKKDSVDSMMKMAGVSDLDKNSTPTGKAEMTPELKATRASLDVSFKQKITAMISSTLCYNRGALVFQYNKPIVIRGEEHKNVIPSHVRFVHAQDLGIIKTDPETGELTDVQIRNSNQEYTKVKDMIYLWNPVTSAKVYNSWFYGTSILAPLLSGAKLIRNLVSETFPAMAKSTWAGVFFLIVKNEGSTIAAKRAEYAELATNAPPGGQNVLIKDPDDVKLENIDYEPKIKDLRELFESQLKMAISALGLPQVAFYDESASNRSTMVGKIQLVLRTTIEPMREWIGSEIAKQWYEPWFRYLYANNPELTSKLKIKLSWADLHISEWEDSIDAALKLDSRKQLKDGEFGELMGLDNYPVMTDPDAETIPGGSEGGMGGGGDSPFGEEGGEGGVNSTGSESKTAEQGAKSAESRSNSTKMARGRDA